MKCSESWLREWVNPPLTHKELDHTLTMGGLEVEEISPVATRFEGIIIGEIREATQHPSADNLQVCKVDIGDKLLTIVCGASNARAHLKVAVATINAQLPNEKVITPATIRGVASEGMLCSGSELSLSDDAEGIIELSPNAPVGTLLWDYLALDDYTIEVAITPNRGDCLSVRGMARDLSALSGTPLEAKIFVSIKETISDTFPVQVDEVAACPHYVGRVIRGVNSDAQTPIQIKERLRRSGIRSISPAVDVTNYVMLELGQPMHAFDLQSLQTGIYVRFSRKGEKISLLDSSEKVLDDETLVIADAKQPIAIAGVMGGMDSAVTSSTKDIFLESAFFSPKVIAKQRQAYQLTSDSAYRFERGVDPTMQREAIERATQLILEICDGKAGPVIEKLSEEHLPPSSVITVTQAMMTQILGIEIPENDIELLMKRLNFTFSKNKPHEWQVSVPSYRFDISIPEDVVEEVARLYGYNRIPTHKLSGKLHIHHSEESYDPLPMRQALSDLGYHEIISYSFINPALQKALDPNQTPRELLNPMTAEMAVMRTNLWPGLVMTYLHNKSRQQQRIRLFEMGTCFITTDGHLTQPTKIAGLLSGAGSPEQWAESTREVDFFDMKGDIESFFAFLSLPDLRFEPYLCPTLHPGQAAAVYNKNIFLGQFGALHPSITRELGITERLFLFEFDLKSIISPNKKRFQEISKFPEIRRDLALLINQAVPAQDIQDTIRNVAGDWLKELFIFDVYQGKGIPADLKSIALALVLQHPTRTLVDEEVTALTNRVIEALKVNLGAELRS